MELVEQIARFKAPKYFSAYVDVLKQYFQTTGRANLINEDIDIGTQLEFGVSSTTLLSLMELGLSRMSAVELYEKIARDDLNEEECRKWIAERIRNLEDYGFSKIVAREIENAVRS